MQSLGYMQRLVLCLPELVTLTDTCGNDLSAWHIKQYKHLLPGLYPAHFEVLHPDHRGSGLYELTHDQPAPQWCLTAPQWCLTTSLP